MDRPVYFAKVVRDRTIVNGVNQAELEEYKREKKVVGSLFYQEKKCENFLHCDSETKDTEYNLRDLKTFKCLKNDTIQLTPVDIAKQSTRIYVSGPSGVGKSVYVAKFLKEYNNRYPERKIYLFSEKNDDESFDDIKNLEIVDLEDMKNEPYCCEDLSMSCCVFDDFDSISDKNIKQNVVKTLNTVLCVGRSYSITVLTTTHKLKANQLSMMAINESNYFTIFTRANKKQNYDFIVDKLGIDKKTAETIVNQRSRTVTIRNHYPQLYITDNEVHLIE